MNLESKKNYAGKNEKKIIIKKGVKIMKNKEQIELAQQIIANTQDYIELAKVQRKLKVENVDKQIDNVTDFIKINAKDL